MFEPGGAAQPHQWLATPNPCRESWVRHPPKAIGFVRELLFRSHIRHMDGRKSFFCKIASVARMPPSTKTLCLVLGVFDTIVLVCCSRCQARNTSRYREYQAMRRGCESFARGQFLQGTILPPFKHSKAECHTPQCTNAQKNTKDRGSKFATHYHCHCQCNCHRHYHRH